MWIAIVGTVGNGMAMPHHQPLSIARVHLHQRAASIPVLEKQECEPCHMRWYNCVRYSSCYGSPRTHINTHLLSSPNTRTSTYPHIHTWTYIHVHTHTHSYTYIHACTLIHIYTPSNTRTSTHVHTYIYINTHTATYIHVYIHIHTRLVTGALPHVPIRYPHRRKCPLFGLMA